MESGLEAMVGKCVSWSTSWQKTLVSSAVSEIVVRRNFFGNNNIKIASQ